MTQGLLHCESIQDGMFSDERIIVVRERGNGPVEFLVEAAKLRGTDVVVQAYQQHGEWWALIPAPYPQPLPIQRDQLTMTG